jgi:leucyl-tRNA synthetase
LVNQGYIEAYAYVDQRGFYVPAAEVKEADGGFEWSGQPVRREYGKMGKSLKNAVSPDELYARYGADTFRLHLMFSGPLEQSRVWDTRAIVGSYRLLQRIWRNLIDERTGVSRVTGEPASEATLRVLHHTVAAARSGIEALRFNTAIARITELTGHLTTAYPDGPPREVAEPLVLLIAPLAPHIAEELWERLGHDRSLAYEPFPEADPAYLEEATVTVPVQVNGKLRARIEVPAGADLEAAARADERVRRHLDGRTIHKVVVVPGRLVNFVVR